ncbi:hypothetical protein EYF80_000056 [Liparis tanakae]|uniref:Uncharacterized protein n=1 Tax=Liparis tanakae TaxID=230148 RepID=A0A4Z2JI17_9TELE|nr:hypothetical protein EYF80_000056 [Liparis tanakae]
MYSRSCLSSLLQRLVSFLKQAAQTAELVLQLKHLSMVSVVCSLLRHLLARAGTMHQIISYMVLCSSSNWASVCCCSSFTVPMSSETVPPRSANSSATLLCSSSSDLNSTEFKVFLGVTVAMRVKALVSLNTFSDGGPGESEGTGNGQPVNATMTLSTKELEGRKALLQEDVGGQSGGNCGRQLRHLPLQQTTLILSFRQLLTKNPHFWNSGEKTCAGPAEGHPLDADNCCTRASTMIMLDLNLCSSSCLGRHSRLPGDTVGFCRSIFCRWDCGGSRRQNGNRDGSGSHLSHCQVKKLCHLLKLLLKGTIWNQRFVGRNSANSLSAWGVKRTSKLLTGGSLIQPAMALWSPPAEELQPEQELQLEQGLESGLELGPEQHLELELNLEQGLEPYLEL